MSSNNILDEILEIKKKFYIDKDSEKAFRGCFAMLACRERKCNQLRKKVNLLEEEINNLKKKLNKNTQ